MSRRERAEALGWRRREDSDCRMVWWLPDGGRAVWPRSGGPWAPAPDPIPCRPAPATVSGVERAP